MKKSIITGLFTLLFSLHSFAADISPEKKKLIDALLEQMGQSALTTGALFADQYIQQTITYLKRTHPDLDPKAYTIVEEEIKSVINEEIVVKGAYKNMLYPIYDKHYSNNELEQLIAFNKTPLGQKVIRVMPTITQEGMQAGQKFGATLGPILQKRIQTRFQAEGIM